MTTHATTTQCQRYRVATAPYCGRSFTCGVATLSYLEQGETVRYDKQLFAGDSHRPAQALHNTALRVMARQARIRGHRLAEAELLNAVKEG